MSRHYIGLDVHKKSISFCTKTADGAIVDEGQVAANRVALGRWVQGLQRPWEAAMEATMFSGWIRDFLAPHARLRERVDLLMSIPGVGQVTALTWALEIGAPHRFPSISKAVSYCGLCSGPRPTYGG